MNSLIALSVGFIVVVAGGWFILSATLGYWLENVDTRQIALQLRGNQPVAVVGPGVHTDLTPFADIKRVTISNIGFCAVDGEVFTRDQKK